jgi:uncharacterized protein (DUF952 family)
MRRIYHFVVPSIWEAQPQWPLRAASLATEGFTHCSNWSQLEWVANKFYAGEPELVVLDIDVEKLTSPLQDEDPGNGELFPHIYGPIDREAVTTAFRFQRGADGRWSFPAEPRL